MNLSQLLTLGMTLLSVGATWLFFREMKKRQALQTALQDLIEQSHQKSLRDSATGLLSEEGFSQALSERAKTADHSGGAFCVVFVVLDNLGQINDGFGQDKGYKVLSAFAQLLTNAFGAGAYPSRCTGGEFAFLVSGSGAMGRDAAQRLAKLTAKPLEVGAARITVSCSIGLAVYPDHGAHTKLLACAAMAMRNVKMAGGGDYSLYEPQMSTNVRDQVSLLNDLRDALAANQFELYFQPKVDAHDLQFTAAEALLRWHHPDRGFVSPSVFIPLAEKYGLMGSIGRWVIEEACKKGAHWKTRGLRMRVAVNISGFQMREEDLVEYIESVIARYEIAPSRFTCEITESVAMEDTKVTQQTFTKMRNAGFHVSIDDFGTGYSSLASLRKLPAAELKIDRAFVMDLETSADARAIAQSIVSLGKTLNLRVVAEGIETPGQCDQLVQMGCDELQGYLFALPMPAEQLEELAFNHVASPENHGFRESLFASTYVAELK